MFLLSSLDVACRRGASNFISGSSCSSACASRMMDSPLHHCHAVAVAQSVPTVAMDRTKCCCRRCAYGCEAVRTWDGGGLVAMCLDSRGA
jgi:hypothetical protein